MTEKILAFLANFIIATISASGYVGVAFLMAIESAGIPLPSEIIMPFAGYLVHTGQLTLLESPPLEPSAATLARLLPTGSEPTAGGL